jgi:transposase
VQRLSEVETLRTVLGQQFPQGPDIGPTKKRPAGRGIIETPHDPEVRCSMKRSLGWQGFKLHITETCEQDLPPLIVDMEITDATTGDNSEVPEIQKRLVEREIHPREQLADVAYVSGENLAHSAEEGIDLFGPAQEDHGAPEGYRQANFQIDEVNKLAKCPAGHTNDTWSETVVDDDGRTKIEIRFDSKTCQACPAFGVCTTCAQGRSLLLNPYRIEIGAARARQKTEQFKLEFRLRSQIEGTISELVRAHEARYTRYRGRVKARLQACFTATAANLKRAIRWLLQQETRATEAAAA